MCGQGGSSTAANKSSTVIHLFRHTRKMTKKKRNMNHRASEESTSTHLLPTKGHSTRTPCSHKSAVCPALPFTKYGVEEHTPGTAAVLRRTSPRRRVCNNYFVHRFAEPLYQLHTPRLPTAHIPAGAEPTNHRRERRQDKQLLTCRVSCGVWRVEPLPFVAAVHQPWAISTSCSTAHDDAQTLVLFGSNTCTYIIDGFTSLHKDSISHDGRESRSCRILVSKLVYPVETANKPVRLFAGAAGRWPLATI